MTDRFFAEPAIHPRLREPGAHDSLAREWQSTGAARIDDALAPGLLARIAAVTPQLPASAVIDPEAREVTWATHIEMPAITGLNYPGCLYRVVRLMRDDLPPLVEVITGARLTADDPFAIRVCGLRMGSYVDAHASGVEAFLWIDAPTWPAEWGGQLELLDDEGAVTARRAPRPGSIDLVTAGRYRLSLLERDVSCTALRYPLIEEVAA